VEAVVTVFAVIFLLCLLLGAYVTVKAVTAAKRGVDRTIGQARRAVEDHTLRARTLLQPGAAGELAELRLTLRTSLRATEDALRTDASEDPSLRESVALFERLKAHGQELDAELKSLENEPDQAMLAQRLPALRERTRRITRSADSLRWAARDRARHFAEDDLDTLSAQIDIESDALRHWTGTGPQHPTAPPSADPAPPAGAQPSARSGPTATPTEPTHGPATGPDPSRPSLTAPHRRFTPSWMKDARPESTT